MKLGKHLAVLAALTLSLGFGAQAASAADKDPIKIGVYLPLTGQNAFGGQLELEGVRLAQKEMPTVLDRPVELVVVDNKSDKVEAANAVKRLVERDKVVALIGTYGSSLAMAGAGSPAGNATNNYYTIEKVDLSGDPAAVKAAETLWGNVRRQIRMR